LISLIPCALGGLEMAISLDRNAEFRLMVSAAGAAALGGLLAVSVLARPRYAVERAWPRLMAIADLAVAAAILLAPVVWGAAQVASVPRRMAAEPMALNNARHLASAMQQYCTDYDDRYPGWMTVDGRPYHNVWDQQLASYVKNDDSFRSGADGPGIRSPSQPAPHHRVLNFAINGLLITKPKAEFDGNANWAGGAASASINAMSSPTTTIMLAEVASEAPMGGPYAKVETPVSQAGGRSRAWRNALSQWIDADPRAWVETRGLAHSYTRNYWDSRRGIGRELHAGGAVYVFCDGHVQYMHLRETVNGGQFGRDPQTYWSIANDGNMWRPR
jgi:prepilin-type processing-associated H-X9-DG protein